MHICYFFFSVCLGEGMLGLRKIPLKSRQETHLSSVTKRFQQVISSSSEKVTLSHKETSLPNMLLKKHLIPNYVMNSTGLFTVSISSCENMKHMEVIKKSKKKKTERERATHTVSDQSLSLYIYCISIRFQYPPIPELRATGYTCIECLI